MSPGDSTRNPDQPNFDLSKIKLPQPENQISKESESEELEAKDLDKAKLRALLHGIEQDIEERKIYAYRIWCLTVCVLIGLAIVLWLNGFQYRNGFIISDKVIIALITSTTVEVIGLFYIVARYLFPSPTTPSSSKPPSRKTKPPKPTEEI